MSYPPPPPPESGSEPPYGPPPGGEPPSQAPSQAQPEQPEQPLTGQVPPPQPWPWPQPWPQQQPPGYPPPYPTYPVYIARPDHPQASTAMVLGIVGLVVCGGFLSPWAWAKGRKAMREIDASGGVWGGRGQAQAGFILGIVGTVVLCFTVLYLIAVAVAIIVGLADASSTGSSI